MKYSRILSLFGAAVLGLGCNVSMANNQVDISNCWIRQMPATVPSGGFFAIQNKTDKEIVLHAVKSSGYDDIMLHQTTSEDGVSKMSMVHDVKIAANSHLDFKPGGYHLMLEKPKGNIQVGDKLKLQFNFTELDPVIAECEVKSPKDLPDTHHHSDHH